MDYGFFYLINHGVENELIQKTLEESRNFFTLPLEEKVKSPWKEHRGYTPLYAEKLDTSLRSKGILNLINPNLYSTLFIYKLSSFAIHFTVFGHTWKDHWLNLIFLSIEGKKHLVLLHIFMKKTLVSHCNRTKAEPFFKSILVH